MKVIKEVYQGVIETVKDLYMDVKEAHMVESNIACIMITGICFLFGIFIVAPIVLIYMGLEKIVSEIKSTFDKGN